MKAPKKAVRVVMPLEQYNTLKLLADEDFRSVPSYIRLVLREYTEQKTGRLSG